MAESIQAERLNEFRGAPFSAVAVEAAVGSIRKQCGWHIAPTREDTEQLESVGRRSLQLPSLHLLEVLEIRDADDPDAEPFAGDLRVYKDGRVKALSGRLPEFCEVTYRHGFEEFPADLLPVVADRARVSSAGRVRAESLASRSITFEVSGDPLSSPIVDLYRLRNGAA